MNKIRAFNVLLSIILKFPEPIIVKHRIKKEEYETRDRQLVTIASTIAREKGYDAVAIATSYYPEVEDPVANIDWEDMNPEKLEEAAGMKVITLEMHKAELLQKMILMIEIYYLKQQVVKCGGKKNVVDVIDVLRDMQHL